MSPMVLNSTIAIPAVIVDNLEKGKELGSLGRRWIWLAYQILNNYIKQFINQSSLHLPISLI